LNTIEEAILRTVLYADVFDFPMTRPEIVHFLIAETPLQAAHIEQTLDTSYALRSVLCEQHDYVCCAGREHLIDVRRERERVSAQLWDSAIRYGTWLAYLPFVRMVALTGALAMRNASAHDDDLDYVLVTTPGRVWIARAFAVLLVRVAKLRGSVICPNYVLAETALSQEREDLYMAHEITQMVPIFGSELYDRMLTINDWVKEHLPNAQNAFYDGRRNAEHLRAVGGSVKKLCEWVLGGWIGDWLENWERQRKLRRFSQAMKTPHSAAVLDETKVKGHFEDHGHPVLRKYYERLRRYNLDEKRLPMAGD